MDPFHRPRIVNWLSALLLSSLFETALPAADPASSPENLARRATAQADSEHNDQYRARFAIDGKIPAPGSQSDLDEAWCVQGATHRNGAQLTLLWTNPVRIAEVVYYGRTAWFAEECWKDCELYSEDSTAPIARARLAMGHGPQRVRLDPPISTRLLRLKFLSSYGGLNPGASEVKIFSTSPPDSAIGKFRPLTPGRPETMDDDLPPDTPQLAARVATGGLGFSQLLLVRRRELNPTHVYTYHVEGFSAGGGLGLYSLGNTESSGHWRELVSSPEGQILDCDLSCDGTQILFSWRRDRKSGYQVYSVALDGSGLRQLTDGAHHNYNACWLPDGGIAFLSTRSSRFAYCWISPVGILHRMERDGTNVRQLSANIVNDFTPSVLRDGRIIYSRWEYVDKPAIPVQSLWTIHPDGTCLAGFFGNRVLSPATFMEARSVPGSSHVLCTLTSHNGPARGAIGLVETSHGNNAQAGIRNLTPEIAIGRVDQGDGNQIRGPYENPFPLDERYFLVSRGGTVLLRDYAGTEQVKLAAGSGGLGYYSPQPVRSRLTPPVLSAPQTDSTNLWATVVLQDVYRGLEPQVRRGEVKELCVVEEMRKVVRTDVANRAFGFQFPVISCGATYAAKKVWGYAPVAPDGSACFQVPAGVPIYFMALDAQGRAVQRMRTFTHLMPGETQGCAGCHEPRLHAVKSQPVTSRQPDRLRPPDWGLESGFDYARVVQPVLDKHCVSCHSGAFPPSKLDLSGDQTDFFNVSYEMLARGRKRAGEAEWDSPYVSWIPTYNGMEQNILQILPKTWGSPQSKLADLLLSGHPTNGTPRLHMQSAETRRILAWIDLNVPYYGTSETAYPERRGCRQLYPDALDKTLREIASRRCAECHSKGVPRRFWVRISNPQRNDFLLSPLSRAAGGTEACGKAIFRDTTDPDYQAIMTTFNPITALLKERPRIDMAGATPAQVDRSCLGNLQ